MSSPALPTRRRLWILLALLAAPASRAQTCSGILSLSFYDVEYEARGDHYIIPIHSLDVTAQFFSGRISGFPTAAEARRAPALRLHGEDRLRRDSRLYMTGTTLAVAPRCGLSLLHLVVVYRDATMTLDLYNVPSHIGLQLSEAIGFRPGRYVLDFATAPYDMRPDGRAYDASALQLASSVRPTPKR